MFEFFKFRVATVRGVPMNNKKSNTRKKAENNFDNEFLIKGLFLHYDFYTLFEH